MKLLSDGDTNAKLAKSNALGAGYRSSILYLAPDTEAGGSTLCAFSTEGCRKVCIYRTGRGNMPNVIEARVRKASYYLDEPESFMRDLNKDVTAFEKKCKKQGQLPAVRPNGTSDIQWEKTDLITNHPEVQFYDYTKNPYRLFQPRPSNYYLTFSLSENNEQHARKILELGLANVAVVFKRLPKEFMGRPVIDGTTHDLRFLDEKGVIVGLLPKGKAKHDQTGFVVDPEMYEQKRAA